ncbi:MAG: toluene ABC transporter ATP-binding protein [Planctomycetes bacterium DG_58]|nr:MAG: toluene ABC transporter ATP-binding protein [Planctomycetes bacterium DG_58]
MTEAEETPQTTPAQTEPVIRVENVGIDFEGRTVLDEISMDIFPGQTAVVMGGSGCGKSTLLRIIVGAYEPTRGRVFLFGQETTDLTPEEMDKLRLRFGILFQSGALYNSMTVGENVALLMREHTDLEDSIIDIMVKMKLELVGLRDFGDLMPAQISGGMKKRVGLARAIALDPEIIFYDEPSAGLDPIVAGVVDMLIMDLSKKLGVTSLVVTHDMNSAFKIADRMFMLYQGRVVAQGTPEEIKTSEDPVVKQFITGAPDGPIPLRMSKTDFAKDLMGE